MHPQRLLSYSYRSFLLICLVTLFATPVRAEDPKPARTESVKLAWEKATAESLDDLKALQKQARTMAEKAMRCTVGIRVGPAGGSGVLISEDGYVLTAGHVTGQAGRDATIILPDGKQLKGKTLGANRSIDSGLIKITEEGTWPHMEMGKSADLKDGQWCIAIGHPAGFRKSRGAVVRVGRVLWHNDNSIRTDCTIQGGDSGGPLFDFDGKVIGIHSRIGGSLSQNIHVPVDTYRATWDRLAASEVWGSGVGGPAPAYLGVEFDPEAEDCVIAKVRSGTAAEKAGIKAGDIVLKFDNQKITNGEDLARLVGKKKPGDQVAVEVERDKETVTLKVTLGKQNG